MSELLDELQGVPVDELNPMEETLLAAAVVKNHLEESVSAPSGQTVSGTLDCPICKESDALHYRRSGYNGHVAAQCETEDCVYYRE